MQNTTTFEVWKSIIRFENYYQISSLGRVKSLERLIQKGSYTQLKKEKILKHKVNHRGYLFIELRVNGVSNSIFIHRLVAIHFIDLPATIPFESLEVNHLDGDKANNAYTNLEWCTHLSNMRHAVETGLKRNNNKTSRKVVNTITGEVFKSIRSAARSCNMNPETLWRYLCGKNANRTSFKYHIKKL